jgi:hypothetical protein
LDRGCDGDDVTARPARDLSEPERRVLEFLLAPPFPGVEELRSQLADLRVTAVSRREGLTRVQFAATASAARAAVHGELPVESQVQGAYPPLKVCLYVRDGLLDALEVADFGGAVADEMPDVGALEPPWCHRPAAPLPATLCEALSVSLSRIAPRGTKVTVSPRPTGYNVEVRHGLLGMTEAGMGGQNDDERRSVVEILDFVQQQIAGHTGQAWPAPEQLPRPRPERPFAPPPEDMEARHRLVDAYQEWTTRLPRPGAVIEGEEIRAWYGSSDHPVVELPPLPAMHDDR